MSSISLVFTEEVRVCDLRVRIFHWTVVVCRIHAGLVFDDRKPVHQAISSKTRRACAGRRHGDDPAGPSAHLSIEDRGPGFPPGSADPLSARFVRGDRAAGGSTGPGPAIVAETMEAHGGRVGAIDRP